jgi:hypothetical protein
MLACPVDRTDAVVQGLPLSKACLILAHPGHESMVYGWLEQAKPMVCLLTAGSEPTDQTQFASTAGLINRVGARLGGIFGRFTEVGLYQTLLLRDHQRFVALASELAEWLVSEQIDCVVGNGIEGISPASDVCRILIDAAVAYAGRERHFLKSYDFLFKHSASDCPNEVARRSLWVELSEDSWNRKQSNVQTTRSHQSEIEIAISQHGLESLRVECLRPTTPWSILRESPDFSYPIERLGIHSPADRCRHAIRFREHILPLAENLRLAAARGYIRNDRVPDSFRAFV